MGNKRPYRYDVARRSLDNALSDLRILAGDEVGPNDVTWQDVAGTCVVNLRVLADQIEQARFGSVVNGPVVFPSPSDATKAPHYLGCPALTGGRCFCEG